MEIPGSFNLAIEQNLLKQQAQLQRELSSSLHLAIGQHLTQQAQQQTIWNGWCVIGEIALCSF
jgi:hypothetical protein